jgi:hypothetical protein
LIKISFEVEPLSLGPFLSYSSQVYKHHRPYGTAIQLTSTSRIDNKPSTELTKEKAKVDHQTGEEEEHLSPVTSHPGIPSLKSIEHLTVCPVTS